MGIRGKSGEKGREGNMTSSKKESRWAEEKDELEEGSKEEAENKENYSERNQLSSCPSESQMSVYHHSSSSCANFSYREDLTPTSLSNSKDPLEQKLSNMMPV